MYDDEIHSLDRFQNSAHFVIIPLPNGLDSVIPSCYGYTMNNIERLIKTIDAADAIERDLAEATSRILRNAIDELQELQDRIDNGDFR